MTRRLLIALSVATLATLSGCGGSSDAGPGSATTTVPATASTQTATAAAPTTPTDQATETVTVYFADPDAMELLPEKRSVPAGGSRLRAALVELAKGPSEAGHQNALPAGTTIVGTHVQGHEALVNLSPEFTTGYPPGGAAAEFAVLAPIVYTATAVTGIERVRITVDGKTPTPVGSQYDWTGAFSRVDFPGAVASP
jgi:spore germination protein GerM